MSRLIVIADSETALGFQLAGVEVVCADDVESARAHLLDLLSDTGVGLIGVSSALLDKFDEPTRVRAESSFKPVVVSLPAGGPVQSFASRREYFAALIGRAIGFHITFPGDAAGQPESTSEPRS